MLCFITLDKAVEVLGFLIGLLYLYWEFKANRLVWIASIAMPCISMWVYFRAGLYADFSMNIYYLLMSVYGLFAWRRKASARHEELQITRFPLRRLPLLLVLTAGAWLVIAWILIRFTDSTVPRLDSLTTALSMVGTWMLARKYLEQWIPWIIVDIICTGLYIYKGIPLYGVLYGLYTVIAIFGIRNWKRLMASQTSARP